MLHLLLVLLPYRLLYCMHGRRRDVPNDVSRPRSCWLQSTTGSSQLTYRAGETSRTRTSAIYNRALLNDRVMCRHCLVLGVLVLPCQPSSTLKLRLPTWTVGEGRSQRQICQRRIYRMHREMCGRSRPASSRNNYIFTVWLRDEIECTLLLLCVFGIDGPKEVKIKYYSR